MAGQRSGLRAWGLGRLGKLSVLPAPAGPVFVELPIDVLYPYFIVRKEVVPAMPPKGLMGRVVSW